MQSYYFKNYFFVKKLFTIPKEATYYILKNNISRHHQLHMIYLKTKNNSIQTSKFTVELVSIACLFHFVF